MSALTHATPIPLARTAFATCVALFWLSHLGAMEPISGTECVSPPAQTRISQLAGVAETEGWQTVEGELREASFKSYEAGYLESAAAWLNLARWARLLGEPETEFFQHWARGLEAARLAHANMPTRFPIRPKVTLARWMPPELQLRLAADTVFLDEFFSHLSPYDYLPEVLRILSELYGRMPAETAQYHSLALAIALVYDTPPPPDWPHGQVSPKLVQRKLPGALETLAFFVQQDRAGRTYQKLSRLGTDELKFVVDVSASFDDLAWSQSVIDVPLAQFAKVYTLVRYRVDRLKNNTGQWPSSSYALPQILAQGGICVDQAYFACQVGKARGVPTLLFRGAGLDGRHAWFGYLDAKQEWQLNAGRYAEQRFVTGIALDPQTWGALSDHTLQFMHERFQGLPSTRRSRIHSDFAREYASAGRTAEAMSAARAAIKLEKRNLAAYEALSDALDMRKAEPKEMEAVWREAIIAFQHYPDLEARFASRLLASLRSRGESSQAEFEELKLIRKYQGDRVDISVKQAAEILSRSFVQAELPEQISTYNQVLDKFGRGAGMSFFDGIVVVFAEHLLQLGQPAEALKVLERARRTLHVEPGGQLEREFKAVESRIRNG